MQLSYLVTRRWNMRQMVLAQANLCKRNMHIKKRRVVGVLSSCQTEVIHVQLICQNHALQRNRRHAGIVAKTMSHREATDGSRH